MLTEANFKKYGDWRVIMHTIGNFVFDSSRLIIYKSDIDKETVDIINATFPNDPDYKSVLSSLTKFNPDEMHMDKIAINDIGI